MCRVLELSPNAQPSAASIENKMATLQHKIFCVCEFIKTESATAVHRVFRLSFNIQPPTRKSICRWNHQFEQIGRLYKDKSSGRPRVSEEKVRGIQESFEHSPRKSTRRASRELGILQPTGWRVLRPRLLFNWVHLFESHCIVSLSLPLRLKNVLDESWDKIETHVLSSIKKQYFMPETLAPKQKCRLTSA